VGEWKAPLSLRVHPALRTEIEAIAAREKRSMSNIGELILEWGLQQIKNAGSLELLLSSKIQPPDARRKRR
jgi:hypothetical protein